MDALTPVERAENRARIAEAKAREMDARAKLAMAKAKMQAATRMYDAVKSSPYRPKRGSPASGDAVMQAARGSLREYARWLDENHDLATGILDDLVAKIVGSGVGIEPTVKDKNGNLLLEVNDQIKELWRYWFESPEVTGELPGPDVERLVCRSWLRDGEVFAQHVTKDSAPHNTDIPYSLELLEADFVPFDYFEPKTGVVHGVQKNVWGQPLGYWCYKRHPGDSVNLGIPFGDLKWIPAENMLHLKLTKRLHQTRGASIFHAVFHRLDDIKDYEESERIAARVAAALTAFIQKSSDYNVNAEIDPATGARAFEMAPGMVFDNLLPGESVGTIKSDRPNPSLESFRDSQMRAVAAGTGTAYSAISRKFDGNYSSQRQELVESSVHYRRIFSYLMWRFYLPVWRRFIDAALFSRELVVPRNVKQPTLYYPEFRPPNLPWIDPLKEMQGFQAAVDGGFKSRYQVIRDMGGDPQAVDAQIAADPFGDRFITAKNKLSIAQSTAPAADVTPVGETAPTPLEEAA